MSGSCTVKTCWMRLPTFRDIGNNLKDRFDGASRVTISNSITIKNHHMKRSKLLSSSSSSSSLAQTSLLSGRSDVSSSSHQLNLPARSKFSHDLLPADPSHKPPTVTDLVYIEGSPDFCTSNTKLGFTGTHGRICSDNSTDVDGCDLMCCGRGFKSEIREEIVRCGCTFQWCCNVTCKTCKTRRIVHTCN